MDRFHCANYFPFQSIKPIVLLLGILSLARPVAADLTVVASVSVDGYPSAGSSSITPTLPLTYTTYFQGELSRMEVSDGNVYIIDENSGVVYQLDAKLSTYRCEPIKQLENFKSQLPKTEQSNLTIDSDLDAGESILTATYLSCLTSDVPIAGYAHISRIEEVGPSTNGSGGRPRGGVKTSSDTNAPGTGPAQHPGIYIERFPNYDVQGDLWASSKYLLPKGKHAVGLPLALQILWGGAPVIGDLDKILGSLGQIPLHAVVTVKQAFSGGKDEDVLNPPTNTISATFDVKSITSLPVDPSQFIVPSTYTKDDSPLTLPELAQPTYAAKSPFAS